MSNKTSLSKKLKAFICILICLILVSGGILAARIIYLNFFADKTATVVIPDNIIGEEPPVSDVLEPSDAADDSLDSENTAQAKATAIEIYKGQASDSERFEVYNMLPGDTEVQYFAVKLSHHADVSVYFNTEVTEQTKNLSDVLHIKVTHLENDKVIYNGSFKDMSQDGYGEIFPTTESTQTVAYYKIEVSLPTSAGNEYQAAGLMADFIWSVRDTAPLDSPQTGDNSNIILYFIIMCCSLVMIIILLFAKRREREVGNAEAK